VDKLIFLGTAGDTQALARQQRWSGGILLMLENNQIHLDPGPGALVCAKLAGYNPRETIGILVTSNSLLRASDADAAVCAMTLDGMDKHGVLLAARGVVENLAGFDPARLSPRYRKFVEGAGILVPGQKIGINEVNILPIRTESSQPDALGLKLWTEPNASTRYKGITIGYTGDSSLFDTMGQEFKNVDYLIVNVANRGGEHEPGKLSLDQAEKLVTQATPGVVILTGFGSKLLEEDLMEIARQVQRATGIETHAATDKQSINLVKKD
jgi:hypothetical protein